jgi:hypothetical protein
VPKPLCAASKASGSLIRGLVHKPKKTARELGCDEDEEAFENWLRKIAKAAKEQKPKKPKTSSKKRA